MRLYDYALDVLIQEKNKLRRRYDRITNTLSYCKNQDKIYDIDEAIKMLKDIQPEE